MSSVDILVAKWRPSENLNGIVIVSSFSETTDSSHPWLGDQNPMDILRTIINTVSIHVQKGGTMTNQEDVLECLQPFCADVTVSAAIKTTVLQLMEESFDLSGEDTFLLLFYQTDAVVSSTWNRKVALKFPYQE